MMKNYECNNCNVISSENAWNKETQKLFITEITPINVGMQGEIKYETGYTCPHCKDYNDAWLIETK